MVCFQSGERHHRDRDENRKRDRINGEDRRRHRDDDSGKALFLFKITHQFSFQF